MRKYCSRARRCTLLLVGLLMTGSCFLLTSCSQGEPDTGSAPISVDSQYVQALADGVVDYIGDSPVYGLYLQIKHAGGVTSFYADCSKLYVQPGQTVKMGDKVAELREGAPAVDTAPHFPSEWTDDIDNAPALPSDKGYFDAARLNRQGARDTALSLLQQAAADEKADQTMIDEANASIQMMASYTMSEASIENQVIARGFADCVAFLTDSSISVVVSSGDAPLNDADVAKISEIVRDETDLPASQIKIIEAAP